MYDSLKFRGRWRLTTWDGGVLMPLKHATPYTLLNFMALGQTVWASVGTKVLGTLEPRPLGRGRG